jgi:predicted transcriptional regulator
MHPIFKLTTAEAKLAELLWQYAPIASMEMIRLAQAQLGWKKSTTFTNLRMLIKKGLTKNEKSVVTMLYDREQFAAEQSACFVDDIFGGSLPSFVSAFTSSRKLSGEQIKELKSLVEAYEQSEKGEDKND